MMDQGPVLVITFNAQQINYVTDSKGAIVEGSKDKIKNIMYFWALCRDQNEIDPKSAWRLMEVSAHATELFI